VAFFFLVSELFKIKSVVIFYFGVECFLKNQVVGGLYVGLVMMFLKTLCDFMHSI
jgi:hypothetical protein